MKNNFIVLLGFFLLFSCSEPVVRKPIIHHSNISYFDESIEINKAINKREESFFKKIITKDTINTYLASPYGFWYYYNKTMPKDIIKAKTGNQVIINYEIRDLNNNIILNKFELGSFNQKIKEDRLLRIDGEDFLLGLHEGIKLMREGEEITFLMPSNKAFGATGLKGKIAPNQPLIIKVKLKQIIK
jgi:gliding motility-associated peptidyl-prolyl isomerase